MAWPSVSSSRLDTPDGGHSVSGPGSYDGCPLATSRPLPLAVSGSGRRGRRREASRSSKSPSLPPFRGGRSPSGGWFWCGRWCERWCGRCWWCGRCRSCSCSCSSSCCCCCCCCRGGCCCGCCCCCAPSVTSRLRGTASSRSRGMSCGCRGEMTRGMLSRTHHRLASASWPRSGSGTGRSRSLSVPLAAHLVPRKKDGNVPCSYLATAWPVIGETCASAGGSCRRHLRERFFGHVCTRRGPRLSRGTRVARHRPVCACGCVARGIELIALTRRCRKPQVGRISLPAVPDGFPAWTMNEVRSLLYICRK